MSARERNKAERRSRIVVAARRMIGETGETVLSMRRLAEQAGVSLATPYNLFGSKQAIIQAVLAADVESFVARASALTSPDATARIFDTLGLAVEVYRAEPDFYRALFTALFDTGSLSLARMFDPPRHAFWRSLVTQALDEGALAPDIDPRLFARTLGHCFGAVMLDWVEQNIDLDGVEAALGYEFALVLAGAAHPDQRDRTGALVRERQRLLADYLSARRRTEARARADRSAPAP